MKDEMEGWRCDTCGKLHKLMDARYTLADNEEKKTFRHWECHKPTDVVFNDLRNSIKRVDNALRNLKGKLK